ncbi:MAG: NBR1-Ig-like domain-containing protein [Chloroflexota bacterium]
MSAPLAYQMVQFSNSVPNFNNLQPGQQFSGTWTLRNTGSTAWPGNWQFVYVDTPTADTQTAVSHPMSGPTSSSLRDRTGREQVNPGDTVDVRFDLIAPTQPGAYAFHWQLRDENGRILSHTHWLRIGVVAPREEMSAPTPRPPADTRTQFGMNVNINPGGHPLDVERLAGLGWVRFVYWASREGHSPEEAYQQRYRQIIQSYASAGIRSLIILHQDTYWGNGPWDSGQWESYAEAFGKECGRVARVCAEFGDMVAFQIFNEQDSEFGEDAGNKNPSAIPIPPRPYALILAQASQAIRAAHPTAKIIFGGLKTGPHNAVRYAREVQQHLGQPLPVDALAAHPYGRYVKTPFFNFGSIGRLEEALNIFKQAFPDLPLWITEVGVAADSHIGPEHYQSIATYMREVTAELMSNFADYVQALIWFGWTDLMRNAGVNTVDGRAKAHIYEAFEEMKNIGRPVSKAADLLTEKADAAYVSYTSTLTNANAVPAGSSFTSRWTFKNSGTTTWDDRYHLVYVPAGTHPEPMTDQTRHKLTEIANFSKLPPEQTAVISLDLTAPGQSGRTYRSQWELRDPQEKRIGFLYQDITVVPAPTAGSGARAADMAFVADQTIPDNTRLVAGTGFDKQWRVRNSGSRHWGDSFRLVYVEGDLQMARGNVSHIVPPARPGEEVTLSVPMTAPAARSGQPTTYRTLWRMQDDRGLNFGDPLWAIMVSIPAVSATPEPGRDTLLARLLNDPGIWYSQRDPAWANDQVGTGPATIGSWGCLMTCMAMALSAAGTRLTPREMNRRAIAIGSQAIDGSVIQFNAPRLIGNLRRSDNMASLPNNGVRFAQPPTENPIQRIDRHLAAGNIVLAQVDTNPNNGGYNSDSEQHWVILVQRTPDGSDYLMLDPLKPPTQMQPRSLMAKYGNPHPSHSHEDNLRHTIKSALIYHL